MSGGYFDYQQWRMIDMADEIDQVIAKRGKIEWNKAGYTPETILQFEEASRLLKRAQVYVQRIDWLLSDDDGEDTFHERLKNDLDDLL